MQQNCKLKICKACSKIGTYTSEKGLSLDEAATKKWFRRSVAEIPECLECEYALVCGGGCAQYAEYGKGTIYKPYCDDFQKAFRVALADEVVRRMSVEVG